MAEKQNLPKLSKSAKRRAQKKRSGQAIKTDLTKFGSDPERILSNKDYNPLVGMTPEQIFAAKQVSRAVDLVRPVAKAYNPRDPLKEKLYLAVKKQQDAFAKKVPEAASLTIEEFADVVAADDLLTTAVDVGGELWSLYQRPQVKDFVNSIVQRGWTKAKDVLFGSTPKTTGSDRESPSLAHSGSESVNLAHLEGCLTGDANVVSDPEDNPRLVFSNRATGEFQVACNANGEMAVVLRSRNFYSNSNSVNNNAFYVWNNAAGYDAQATTATGTWAGVVGPLGASQNLFVRTKVLGCQVTVTPLTSMDTCEGNYVSGFFNDQQSESLSSLVQNVYSFDMLSQVPYFRVSDMKTSIQTRMFPTPERTVTEWQSVAGFPSPSIDYGSFAVIVSGASPGATLSFRWSMAYSVLPSNLANNLIRGSLPPMGPGTTRFAEYLLARFPEIVNWPEPEVCKLFDALRSVGSDAYSKLVLFSFTAPALPKAIPKGKAVRSLARSMADFE